MSSPAAPAPVSGIAPPRPPSTSPPPLSQPFVPPPPSETIGRSRTPRTTAATSPWARIALAFAAIRASSPGSAALPSTSSRPTAEAHFRRTASAPPSVASITSLASSTFHSVEQPCDRPPGLRGTRDRRAHRSTLASHGQRAAGSSPDRPSASTKQQAVGGGAPGCAGHLQQPGLRELAAQPDRAPPRRWGPLSRLGSQFLPHPAGRRAAAPSRPGQAARASPTANQPPRPWSLRGLELGHHLDARPDPGRVLLPLPDPRHLQPQDRRLGGPCARKRRTCRRPRAPCSLGRGLPHPPSRPARRQRQSDEGCHHEGHP